MSEDKKKAHFSRLLKQRVCISFVFVAQQKLLPRKWPWLEEQATYLGADAMSQRLATRSEWFIVKLGDGLANLLFH